MLMGNHVGGGGRNHGTFNRQAGNVLGPEDAERPGAADSTTATASSSRLQPGPRAPESAAVPLPLQAGRLPELAACLLAEAETWLPSQPMATGSMARGLLVAPMGWVLLLAATVTPQWREFPRRPGFPPDVSFSEGLWESCVELAGVLGQVCWALPPGTASSWPTQMLRALTVISVLTGALGYALAHLGAWWWTDHPRPKLAGTAGLLLVGAGAAYLCAASYVAYSVLETMASPQTPAGDKFQMGTCLYLGWSGGAAESVAGVALASSWHREGEAGRPGEAAAPYEVDY
ncbi:LOW QUALITY PROTEIN: claudin-7-like [Pelodiscus sinensis]|uniref:LOW QUALITY PROTEIN: claudin-7-like n=1 Tax=Pelodiscus sinensis TaxID=13735 RepID=UPI003F6B7B53